MRVLVCGSRGFGDIEVIRTAFGRIPYLTTEPVTIIEGGAKGADTLARQVAEEYGYRVDEYPITEADWSRYGNGAGPRRNQKMLDEGRPDMVLAFALTVNITPGTADMIQRAQYAGLPVIIYLSHLTRE